MDELGLNKLFAGILVASLLLMTGWKPLQSGYRLCSASRAIWTEQVMN